MKIRWPLLHVFIEIPFIRIHSSLMFVCYEGNYMEYIRLDFQIWKWTFDVALRKAHK